MRGLRPGSPGVQPRGPGLACGLRLAGQRARAPEPHGAGRALGRTRADRAQALSHGFRDLDARGPGPGARVGRAGGRARAPGHPGPGPLGHAPARDGKTADPKGPGPDQGQPDHGRGPAGHLGAHPAQQAQRIPRAGPGHPLAEC
ncbi:MAG: hypothetical protein PHV85_00255 [Desulfovibrionaceae bacterium]|nr:hypothetical protein [Desulfovibrionaceae bacterium]